MIRRISAAAITVTLAYISLPDSARAADAGRSCCADLEERVAELEETAARKGNRKLSLEVSGYVNKAVMFWDDGAESDAYVVTNDSGRTRFRFKGEGKISDEWKAGYYIEVGLRDPRSDRVNQLDDSPPFEIDTRQANWYVRSKSLGEVRIGRGNGASEGITEINVAHTASIAKNSDVEDFSAGFFLREAGSSGAQGLSAFQWRRLVKDDFLQPGEGDRGNFVLYSSPEFKGFTFETAWGEDDFWDIGLRYKGEIGKFEIAAGIAYGKNTDTNEPTLECIVSLESGAADCSQVGGSVSVKHTATGLFLTFGAGVFWDDLIGTQFAAGTRPDDEYSFFALQSGLERKWLPLGETTLYGEYFRYQGGANDRNLAANDPINPFPGETARLWDSEVEVFGGGIVQEIDAAAMFLYVTWRHFEADALFRVESGVGPSRAADLDDLDVVMSGALIRF